MSSLLRQLADVVREQVEAARPPAGPPIRPTSLREAGAVGESAEGRDRSRRLPASDSETGIAHRDLYPERPVVNDQDPRVRRSPVQPLSRAPRPESREAFLAALRSPAALRTAILVREVLDPPLALRDDRLGDSQRGGR